MNKIFKDAAQLQVARDLLMQSVKLSTFSDNANYNPFRDDLEQYKMKLMDVSETTNKLHTGEVVEYNIVTVSKSRSANILSGRTKITDGIVAGTLLYTLSCVGKEKFVSDWDKFIIDHEASLIPADITKVYDMLRCIAPLVEIKKPTCPVSKAAQNMIKLWQHDLATSSKDFCESPDRYKVYSDPKLYKCFKDTVGKQSTVMSRFLKLTNFWKVGDEFTALCWCMVSGVHPVRLLNFIGYYLTHRSNQPLEFSRTYAETQLYEVPVVDSLSGNVVDYKPATSQFSAGFINKFSVLVNDIDFDVNPIGEDFIDLTLRFMLEDFAMPETLQWQSLPLSVEGAEYYKLMGITEENFDTVRELTNKVVRRGSTEQDNKKLEATGNPLFDISMQQNEENN